MSNRHLVMIVVLIAAIAVGARWYYVANTEVVEEEDGFGNEARRDPHLALRLFLDGMGIPSRSERFLRDTPDPDEALMLFIPRRHFGTRYKKVLDYVRRGGHLIVTPSANAHEGDIDMDPIFEAVGVEVWQSMAGEMGEGLRKTSVHPSNAFRSLELITSSPRVLTSHENNHEFCDGDAQTLMHFVFGKGRITVLADHDFLSNEDIRKGDHARLIWRLLTLRGKPGAVVVVRRDEAPSMVSFVWDPGWPVLLAGAGLLFFWLWFAGARFGPRIPDDEPVRRSMREHLQAAGRFLWKKGARRDLLRSVRQGCLEHVLRRHPDLAGVPEEERITEIASRSGVSPANVRRAFTSNPDDPQTFARIVRDLERVRRKT